LQNETDQVPSASATTHQLMLRTAAGSGGCAKQAHTSNFCCTAVSAQVAGKLLVLRHLDPQ